MNKLVEIEIIKRYYLLLLLIVYLVCATYLLGYYRYYLNPDGVSYITIAEKYAAGNFRDAVNGYWGPMISWLAVPLLWLGVEPLLSIKILNIIIGIPTILAMWWLSDALKLSLPTRRAILLPAVIYVSYFANFYVTPDLLLSCTLLLYFIFIFRQRYTNSSKQGFLCGFWGGMAYLVKSFAFPYFIAHFVLMNFIAYFANKSKPERKTILANFICGFILFGIISGFWIITVSSKYKKLTFSVSKDMNLYEISPYSSSSDGKWYNKGLYPPPNKTALSAGEDPYFILDRLPRWRPYESLESFRHYVKVIKGHIRRAVSVLNRFSFLSAFIFIAYLFIILRKPRKILNQPEILILYPFISLLLLIGGYSMIRLEERLIWPSVFLLLLMAGFVIERLHQNTFFTRLRRIVVYIIVVVSFIIQPIRTLYDRVLAYPAGPVASSHNMQINLLKRYIQNGDSIASYGGFGATHRLSFFLRARYYGMTVNTEDLYKYKIQHFFVWSNDPAAQELPLPGYRNYLHLPAMNLTIYGFIDDKDSLDPVR